MKQHEHRPELAGTLWMYHFPPTPVTILWEDGSHATWEHAFWRREADFVVVYTEHCGYFTLFAPGPEDALSGQEGPRPLTESEQAEYDAWHRARASS
jgi:hypothetical protein